MPEAKGNPFVHLELSTTDAPKAKAFYSGLFGWEFADNDMGGGMIYSTFKPADGPGGGLFSMPGGNNGWTAYVGVEDIHGATAKAKELGAEICMDSHEIPNIGWMTVMKDPTGCTIAMFQPKPGSAQM
ncbi:MAG: VOC family protein [Acidobacteriota bacterium]